MSRNTYNASQVRALDAQAKQIRDDLCRTDGNRYYWWTKPRAPCPLAMTEQRRLSRRLGRVCKRLQDAVAGELIEMRYSAEKHVESPRGYIFEDRFVYFNNVLFDGRLPKAQIEFQPMTGKLGEVHRYPHTGEFVIWLNECYDWTIEELDGIIIHEMIHIDVAVDAGVLYGHIRSTHNRYNAFWPKLVECQAKTTVPIPITEMTYDPRPPCKKKRG